MKPRASVIVSTYNRPENLERCLEGFRWQTTADFELLVADDGSDDRTAALVGRYASLLEGRVRHVWHEDRGFRKCTILNQASRDARADHLIYTDGDCVPHRRFVEAHLRHRKFGHYLVGRAAFLSERRTREIGIEDVRRGTHARVGLGDVIDVIRRTNRNIAYGVYLPGELSFRAMQRLKKNRNARGGNLSLWKHDLERVNGWNEDFESWGLEDVELGFRLRLAGLVPLIIVNRAVCVHLWHPASRVEGTSARKAYNESKIRAEPWCPNGLEKEREERPVA